MGWQNLHNANGIQIKLFHLSFLELKVTKLEAKFKLSQNKSDSERKNTISALTSADEKTGTDIAEFMKKDNK
jgi:predicted FMN-binding regulatory protein PaiB